MSIKERLIEVIRNASVGHLKPGKFYLHYIEEAGPGENQWKAKAIPISRWRGRWSMRWILLLAVLAILTYFGCLWTIGVQADNVPLHGRHIRPMDIIGDYQYHPRR